MNDSRLLRNSNKVHIFQLFMFVKILCQSRMRFATFICGKTVKKNLQDIEKKRFMSIAKYFVVVNNFTRTTLKL